MKSFNDLMNQLDEYYLIAEALDPADYESKQSKKGSLFLGRMQPIHNGHDAIIKMLKHKPYVVVVKGAKSSKDTSRNPFSFKYQKELIYKLNPKVDVIEFPTGYIPDMINAFRKDGIEIVEVLAGEDRIGAYKKMIQSFNMRMPDDKKINVTFKQTPRVTSATTVRNAIRADDIDTFKANVPKKIHGEWNKMKKILGVAIPNYPAWEYDNAATDGGAVSGVKTTPFLNELYVRTRRSGEDLTGQVVEHRGSISKTYWDAQV